MSRKIIPRAFCAILAVLLLSLLPSALGGCTEEDIYPSPIVFDFELHIPTVEVGFADGYGFVLCKDGTVMITDGGAARGEVTIPSTIAGKTVVGITDGAFSNNTQITSITLPSELEYIAAYAFSGCSSLQSVNINEKLWRVGAFAFDGTPWLDARKEVFVTVGDGILIDYRGDDKEIIIPNDVKHIGGAFATNETIMGITLHPAVCSISDYSFAGCLNLRQIDFGESLAFIGDGAFSANESIQSVILPDTVKHIGTEAFVDCYEIKYLYLGKTLRTMGDAPFNYCQGIRAVFIPSTLGELRSSHFTDCLSLMLVLFDGTEEEFEALALNDSEGSFKRINKVFNYSGGKVINE